MRRAQSLTLLIAFSAAALQAQTTFATITGTVLDPSGLTVPGARVQAVQLESGYKYEAQTNAAGVYTLADLRAGTYDLTITAGGFKDAQVKGVELVSRDVRRLDVPMQLGQVATSVEVSGGGATLVETETARISQTRPAYDMEALPLNTRSLTAFLSLSPGVVSASDVTAPRRFAGSRRNQSDVAVDGVSTTASNGTQISPLTNYIESFSEARVDMANNTADASAIGEVTAVSKAGTNQLSARATRSRRSAGRAFRTAPAAPSVGRWLFRISITAKTGRSSTPPTKHRRAACRSNCSILPCRWTPGARATSRPCFLPLS